MIRKHSYSDYLRWYDRAFKHGLNHGISDRGGISTDYSNRVKIWFWDVKDQDKDAFPITIAELSHLPQVGMTLRTVDYRPAKTTDWKTFRIVSLSLVQDSYENAKIHYDVECEEVQELSEL